MYVSIGVLSRVIGVAALDPSSLGRRRFFETYFSHGWRAPAV